MGNAGIQIDAGGHAGAVRAGQLLRQEAGPEAYRRSGSTPWRIPHLRAHDRPVVAWRGVLLDLARHFLPKSQVFRVIDVLSMHDITVLQLHLTDDQGWRIDIPELPRLTEIGVWRTESNRGVWRAGEFDGRPHGGFYTQDDLREIVAYARERSITVVPEVDVPGHSAALIAAYPEVGMPDSPRAVRTSWGISDDILNPCERTLDLLTTVLSAVAEIFDSPYLGIGGDEVPTDRWHRCTDTAAQAAALGLASVDDLHHWFLARLAERVIDLGRRPLLWDDGWRPQGAAPLRLPEGSVVTVWHEQDLADQVLADGYDVVLAPESELYFDHRQSEDPGEPVPVGFARSVSDVYARGRSLRQRMLAPRPSGHGVVLGAQAQVWTEHLDDARRLDFALLPRLAAFAEITGAAEPEPVEAFIERLKMHHLPRLDAWGVEYRPLSGPLPWQRRPGVAGWPLPR